jgi:hypothetical protein
LFPSSSTSEQEQQSDTKKGYYYNWQPPYSEGDTIDVSKLSSPLIANDVKLRRKAILEAPCPSFQHDFSKLISNANVLSKSELSSYETLRRKFNALVNQVLAVLHPSSLSPAATNNNTNKPFNISKKYFYHVCSQYRCNCFGVFTDKDTQVALAVYPHASYFNHACDPNLIRRMEGKCATFYAKRDIGKGEALTICYAGGFASTNARREHLLEHYRFWCRCEACKEQRIPAKIGMCTECFAEGYVRNVLDEKSVLVGKECEACLKFTSS